MHKVQWKVPYESLNAEVIRQQVLYGGEHSIDLHFVDGVTECNIMPLKKCVYGMQKITLQLPYT